MNSPPLVPSKSRWFEQARALFLKDLRAELRTKVAVSAVGLFAFSSLLLLALATAALKEVKTAPFLKLPDPAPHALIIANFHPAWDDTSKMGMLWVLFCFAAFAGLSHSFVHEEETGTTMALRLSMSASAVYTGKLVFNGLILFAVAVIITPIYMLLTGMNSGPPAVFVVMMLSGCIGLAGAATIIAALTAKARGTGALYGAVGLPIIVMFLLLLLNAANSLYDRGTDATQMVKNIGGLLSFGILMITVSALTFHFVWED